MAQRNIKARYRTTGPMLVKVRTRVSRMVKIEGSDMPKKEDTFIDEEREVFMVHFPQGHSIRVSKAELIRMGYHLKPRLVDMNSGDVIDIGGDPYDFVGEVPKFDHYDDGERNYNLSELIDDDEPADTDKVKAAKG